MKHFFSFHTFKNMIDKITSLESKTDAFQSKIQGIISENKEEVKQMHSSLEI